MTRIIAGFAGSLALVVPAAGTRPTSDRVREAIFSSLESRDVLGDARVLDLYAGSGALGLEAASRGASRVALVDSAPVAAAACRRNAGMIQRNAPGAPPEIEISSQAVAAFLAGSSAECDLVFVDPPYELGEKELAAALELLVPRLSAEAVVLIERSSRAPEPLWPAGLGLERSKKYGDTTLWWAQPARPDQSS